MAFDFDGRRVVVAGGSRGIGRSIALAFAQAGAGVSICARGAEDLARTDAEIAAHGRPTHSAACDLADRDAIVSYISEAAAALGGIDVLVNNASAFGFKDDEEGWAGVMSVDMMATVRTGQAAIPFLEHGTGPCIINISSVVSLSCSAARPPYAAMKAVPGGGSVLIYSDITERKRSEAEIRAARDAAEAAYRDLKAAQASLIRAEKMASLGQLTAGIAHEIKNPLNFVNNFADLSVELLDELKETAAPAIAVLDEDNRTEIDETIGMLTGNLEKIAEHGRRADGIVKSMLEHSRGTSGERRSVDLNGLMEEALNLAYHGGRAQDASFNITLERDFALTRSPQSN
jgi:NADP-dependent 3-hydroxy acid dehydrogenase YdfG